MNFSALFQPARFLSDRLRFSRKFLLLGVLLASASLRAILELAHQEWRSLAEVDEARQSLLLIRSMRQIAQNAHANAQATRASETEGRQLLALADQLQSWINRFQTAR